MSTAYASVRQKPRRNSSHRACCSAPPAEGLMRNRQLLKLPAALWATAHQSQARHLHHSPSCRLMYVRCVTMGRGIRKAKRRMRPGQGRSAQHKNAKHKNERENTVSSGRMKSRDGQKRDGEVQPAGRRSGRRPNARAWVGLRGAGGGPSFPGLPAAAVVRGGGARRGRSLGFQ
jgi:hypothetical protein